MDWLDSKRLSQSFTAGMYLQGEGTLLSSSLAMLSPCKRSTWGSTLGAIWGNAATCLQSPGVRVLPLGVTPTGQPCCRPLWFIFLIFKPLADACLLHFVHDAFPIMPAWELTFFFFFFPHLEGRKMI